MPGPATVDDLKNRSLRPLTPAEETVGGVLVDDAWTVILSQRPSVADRVATDDAFRALVVQVQCAMVLRVLRNPDGKLEEQIDDYRWRRDTATSTGALYLTDAELALLGSGEGTSDGAWTIRSTPDYRRGYWLHPDAWVPYA
jgi:hypothetical protein